MDNNTVDCKDRQICICIVKNKLGLCPNFNYCLSFYLSSPLLGDDVSVYLSFVFWLCPLLQ